MSRPNSSSNAAMNASGVMSRPSPRAESGTFTRPSSSSPSGASMTNVGMPFTSRRSASALLRARSSGASTPSPRGRSTRTNSTCPVAQLCHVPLENTRRSRSLHHSHESLLPNASRRGNSAAERVTFVATNAKHKILFHMRITNHRMESSSQRVSTTSSSSFAGPSRAVSAATRAGSFA